MITTKFEDVLPRCPIMCLVGDVSILPQSQTKAVILPLATAPRRNLWQRRIIDPVVAQLTQGITPEKITLTIAIGSACALFPIFGATTLLCFVVALVLRLNQPIIQLLNQALWPVHVPAILLCVRFGEFLFGVSHQPHFIQEMYRLLAWKHSIGFWDNVTAFGSNLAEFFHRFAPTALHAIAAWAVLTPLFIVLCYYPLLPLMRIINRIHHEQKAKQAAGP
jgi:uncharacterized protein (DUF2062 family)